MRKPLGLSVALSAIVSTMMFCVTLLVCSPLVSKGDDVSGVITGYVYDQYSRPLSGARISLKSDNTVTSTRRTNRNGFFSFLAVLPGSYDVLTSLDGYDIACAGFYIIPNRTQSAQFRMRPAIRSISRVTVGHVITLPGGITSWKSYNPCGAHGPVPPISF